ncbi:Ribonuclease H-like domain containing protein, partial [Parasponia andersonii]
FRTSRGFFKGDLAISIGKAYAFEAELADVIHAIFYAWDLGWNNLWLESDLAYLVLILKSHSLSVPWRWRPSWMRCLRLISKIHFHVSHVFCEGNVVVDILVSRATSIQAPTWWHTAPSFIHDVIKKDYSGLCGYRFS